MEAKDKEESMKKISALSAVLLVVAVVGGPAALAQTATAPNSGAGVPGSPGNKSSPAVKPGVPQYQDRTRAKFQGCPETSPGRHPKN